MPRVPRIFPGWPLPRNLRQIPPSPPFSKGGKHALETGLFPPLTKGGQGGFIFNPDFAIGRGIRRRRPDIFFLRKFVHGTTMAFTFFVETISASFVSVLTPIAKFGFKTKPNGQVSSLPFSTIVLSSTQLDPGLRRDDEHERLF